VHAKARVTKKVRSKYIAHLAKAPMLWLHNRRMPALNRWKFLVPLLPIAFALAACGNSKDAAIIYVLTPPQKASLFTQDLAAIAKRHRLAPDLGNSVPDDHGRKYFVVEASGRWLRLWSQNEPLSPDENSELCGRATEPRPDPGQYVVTIDHRFAWLGLNQVFTAFSTEQPRSLSLEISKELRISGYTVRSSPLLCSPLAKAAA